MGPNENLLPHWCNQKSLLALLNVKSHFECCEIISIYLKILNHANQKLKVRTLHLSIKVRDKKLYSTIMTSINNIEVCGKFKIIIRKLTWFCLISWMRLLVILIFRSSIKFTLNSIHGRMSVCRSWDRALSRAKR